MNSSPAVSDGASSPRASTATSTARRRERQAAWRFKTGGERRFTAPGIHGLIPRTEMMADPYDVLMSSPAVAGGDVYIGSGDHYVYALDAHSAASCVGSSQTGNVVHASPAVASGVVYIGSWDRYLYALDARSQATFRWQFFRPATTATSTTRSASPARPRSSMGSVYFGCRDSHFYALDARTGQLRWKHDEHGSWVIGSPASDGIRLLHDLRRSGSSRSTSRPASRALQPVLSGAFSFFVASRSRGNIVYYGTFDGTPLRRQRHAPANVVERFATDGSAPQLFRNISTATANLVVVVS